MEALAEQVVGTFLTQGGKVSISPGYNVGNGWSCPDFVALDFDKHEVVVVEVTTASNIATLLERVKNRDSQWFSPLRSQLVEMDAALKNWEMRFLGFVRQECLKRARDTFADVPGVTFAAVEDTTFSWKYWERREGGLPR
jgi:hypothetical protein